MSSSDPRRVRRAPEQFEGTERYEVVRMIGHGGSGTVYEVFDRAHDAAVALKLLHQAEPDALLRFKQEFRSQADISHPNLVALHELVCEEPRWFFTMELIDGCNLGDYIRGRPRRDRFHAIRQTLAGVVRGTQALHEVGLVHRDLKPSNVMVDRDGRAIVLDFGLVTRAREPLPNAQSRFIMGTPNYVSPEHVTGDLQTSASDWYSLGVILYELLTGHPPFSGAMLEMLWARTRAAPRAGEAADVPSDLDELCADLMRVVPEARPTGEQILDRLGEAPARPRPRTDETPTPAFVGREAHLAQLASTLKMVDTGSTPVVLVHGPSGMGKSTLLAELARRVRAASAGLVFEGRCFERETVPFSAFDTIVDALARHLEQLHATDRALVLDGVGAALARVFPVLGQLMPAQQPIHIADPLELRRQALGELRTLLRNLSATRPVVICIDDLQWGDLDSARVIGELTRGPDAARLMIVVTFRRENLDTSPILQYLMGSGRALLGRTVVDLPVDELAPKESLALARALIKSARADSVARAIAGEAAGNPLFICELSRYETTRANPRDSRPSGVRDLLHARIRSLPEPSRRLLEVVAAAGRPVGAFHCVAAADLSEDGGRALGVLRANHLVRADGERASDRVEPYHDQVRQAALTLIPHERLLAIYRSLASVIGARSDRGGDAEMLATLWRQAGDDQRAAHHARRAADAAADALAFERAIAMYRAALGLDPDIADRRGLELRLAQCLANAGHGRDAAAAFLGLVDDARDINEHAELTMYAANQLLRVGEVSDGMTYFERVFEMVGLPSASTPRRALLALLGLRARIRLGGLRFKERKPSAVRAESLLRVDTCWTASAGMGFVDTVRGAEIQSRGLILALQTGDAYRIARALASEAAYRSSSGGEDDSRVVALIERASDIAHRADSPHALALCNLAAAVSAYCRGHWKNAFEHTAPAIIMFRDACLGAQWELACMRLVRLWSRVYLGRLRELATHVDASIVDADAHGDVYTATQLRTGQNNLAWVARGDVEQARAQVERALAEWPGTGFQLQHFAVLQAQLHIDLYEGRIDDACARMAAARRPLAKSKLLYVQQVLIEALHLEGCLAVAVGDVSRARRMAKRIRRQKMRWGEPLARLVLAGSAATEGDTSGAVEHLRAAADTAEAADMAIHAAIARLRLASVLHDAEGDQIGTEALAAFRRCGVTEPIRWAGMWCPGF